MIDLNLPANPYGQGYSLDSSPFTNYYIQQEAHKRAKDEAFNKYLNNSDVLKSGEGVRSNDVGGFTKRIDAWRNYAIQNKKAINNPTIDGGVAYTAAQKMYEDARLYADRSKRRTEIAKTLIAPLRTKPDIWDRVDARTMDKISANDKALDDNGSADFDMSDLEYRPANYDWAKAPDEVIKGIPFDKSDVAISPIAGDRYNQLYTTKKSFSKENLQKLGELFRYNYNQPKSSLRYDIDNNQAKLFQPSIDEYGRAVIPNQDRLHSLNEKYKNVFGRDMDLSHDDHSDLAVAMGLDAIDKHGTSTEIKANEATKRAAEMEDYRKKSNIIASREISVAQTKKRLGLSGKDADVAINDAYSRINNSIGNNEDKKLSELNLGADDVALIMQMAKNSLSANVSATPDAIKVNKDKDGVAHIRLDDGSGTSIPLGSLSATGVNSKANPKDRKTRSKILGAKNTSPTVHRAKMPDGRIITSSDGVNWTDEKGNPVK